MKEYHSSLCKFLTALLLFTLLSGCGGSSNSPKYSISASVNSLSFSNEVLQPTTEQLEFTVSFDGGGLLLGYAPDTQPAAWLNFATKNVTANSATVVVTLVNAEFLAAEQYQTRLRLATGDPANTDLVHVDIDVSLLIWQLATDRALISFAEVFGACAIASQTLSITSEHDQWQAAVDVPWLSLDVSEGTGSASISITPDISALDHAGRYQANLILTELSSGDQKMVPIELGLDNVYLFANRANIAFTATANQQMLSKTVKINSNSVTPVTWQASTDSPWLTLSPNLAANELTITANPALAPANAQTDAQINVSSTVNESVVAETLHVSLYLTEQASDTLTLNDLTINNDTLVLAPTKPLIYLGIANELKVYQQYTGELLNSLAIAPPGCTVEKFVIHPDGHLLLAQANVTTVDEQGMETTSLHRYQVDLNNLTSTELDLTDASIAYDPMRFVRFAGRYFVVSQVLEYADENLHRLAWQQTDAYFARAIDSAVDNDVLFALDGSTEQLKRYSATVNDFTSTTLSTSLTHSYRPESLADNEHIFAFMLDQTGNQIYLQSPHSEWLSFDAANEGSEFVDHGLLEANTDITTITLVQNSLGQANFIRFDPSQGFILNRYNQQQNLSATQLIGTAQPTQAKISADSLRLISYAANSHSLSILNLIP